jgi:hypothetical protein
MGAAVIEQNGWERFAALRAPEHRVQGDRLVVDDYGFSCKERSR